MEQNGTPPHEVEQQNMVLAADSGISVFILLYITI